MTGLSLTSIGRAPAALAVVLVAAIGTVTHAPAARAEINQPIATRLAPDVVGAAYPGADGIGAIAGEPPIAPVLKDGAVVGYVFSTHETVSPRGYSGESFDIMVGLDLGGRITGTALLDQHEPMIGPSLIPEERLERYFERLKGLSVTTPVRKSARGVDGVSGATISATLMHSAILNSARKVARLKGVVELDDQGGLSLDLDSHAPAAWPSLVADRSVAQLTLTHAQARAALAAAGGDSGSIAAAADKPLPEPFIELYAALATPAGIGRNLFGDKWYSHHMALLGFSDQLLFVAGRGAFSWKGVGQLPAGQFGRVRLVQADKVIELTAESALQASAVRADGAPRFDEIGLFRLRRESGFDPLKPWQLDLAIGQSASGPARLALTYILPPRYVVGDQVALEAAGLVPPRYVLFGLLRDSALSDWQRVWVERVGDIAILLGLLTALTLLLVFQAPLARSRRLHLWTRTGFLAVVLIWLGWIADAQLTSLNLIAYLQALFGSMDWRLFLIDPLIFLLSVYVGLSLILWGRGVFCGWLCPFGAMQELLNKIARALGVPQLDIAEPVQKRLWLIKYAVVAVVFGSAVLSVPLANALAEVEPFKTAIIVKFERSWPFLIYAGVLLGAGLFVERFFCRYLCPLGGALALLGRFHLFDWLKRRPQCGNPCRVCEASCPVGAIQRNGRIDMNECFQCLDCQVDYADDQRCPPLAAERKRLSRAQRRALGASDALSPEQIPASVRSF